MNDSNVVVGGMVLFSHQFLEVGVGFVQVQFLDPDIAIAHVVAFALEFQSAGSIGDA